MTVYSRDLANILFFLLFSDINHQGNGECGETIIESEHVGTHSFATMAGDQDIISHERLQGRSPEEMRIYEQHKVYVNYFLEKNTFLDTIPFGIHSHIAYRSTRVVVYRYHECKYNSF